MQVIQLSVCKYFAFAGLLVSLRTTFKMAAARGATAIMAYAFLSATIALAVVVVFETTGTAVASMYDAIATAFIASTPQSP